MTEKKRSIGVAVFSGIQSISGVIGFLLFFVWGMSGIFKPPYDAAKGVEIYGGLGICGVVISFLYLALFFLGLTLFKLKSLARKMTLWLSPIYTGLICLLLAFPLDRIIPKGVGRGSGQPLFDFWLCFVIITIYFFTRPKVKEQFK